MLLNLWNSHDYLYLACAFEHFSVDGLQNGDHPIEKDREQDGRQECRCVPDFLCISVFVI